MKCKLTLFQNQQDITVSENCFRWTCWKSITWNAKVQEKRMEMNEHKIHICALCETKRGAKRTMNYLNYSWWWWWYIWCKRKTYSGNGSDWTANGKYIQDRNITYRSPIILSFAIQFKEGILNKGVCTGYL